jgi:tetratricopeptide (TPR) repeat protein
VQAAAALEKLARGKGDWVKVADLLSRREDSTPEADRRALYLELAQVLSEKLHRAPQALPYLERALALSPDDPAVLEPLADLYFAADRLDDALPLYTSLAERMQKARRMKDVGRLRFRLGAISEKRGDQKAALEAYASAHQIDPSHALTLAALGRLYTGASDWEKARGIYRKMLLQNLDPAAGITKADVYLHLGEIHEKLNEAPKAIGMYERGLEIDAGHAALRAALTRVKH